MTNYTCPSCGKNSITRRQKYAMGYWMTRRCGACNALLCATPLLLGVLTFAYLWDLLFFIGMSQFNHSLHYFVYMIVIWFILDLINLKYVPLSVMRG